MSRAAAPRRVLGPLLAAALVWSGCGDAPPRSGGPDAADAPAEAPATDPGAPPGTARAPADGAAVPSGVVRVHLLRGEELAPVERTVPPGASVEERLAGTLRALLAGPTEEERERGLLPPFGPAGPEVLDSVRIGPDGRAVVDFGDLPAAYPSGSASAAGNALLASLEATLFQFEEVREAEIRARGSCEAFWAWLQRDCRVLRAR